MADEDTPKDSKTFDPTERRKREFREEGKVAVSRDVASTAQLVAVLLGFMLLGGTILTGMYGAAAWTFEHAGAAATGAPTLSAVMAAHFDALALPLLALVGLFGMAAFVGYVAQTRFNFSTKAIGFKFERLRPLKRLGQLLGPKPAAVKIGLTMGKLGLSGAVLALALAEVMPSISRLGLSDLSTVYALTETQIRRLFLYTLLILAVLATLDLIYQRRKLLGEIKMTREEVKRETEEEEGRPEVRQKRRQRHRELSMNRIIEVVPEADVVLTNPTHYAVALRYRPAQDAAPIVTAKGVDEMARHIRAIARKHNVPVVEQRSLARTIWATVRVGKPIPSHLFQSVALVLARVFRARGPTSTRVERPSTR